MTASSAARSESVGRRGVLRCGVAAALFGATTPLASRLAAHTSAPVLAGLLYIGAAIAVAPFAARRSLDRQAVRTGAPRLAVAVVSGGFLGPLLLAGGLARTPAATASLLLNVELVATTAIAALVFKEHLGGRVVAGAAAVVAAGALLVASDAPDLRLGAALIVGACACWGVDNCVTANLDQISAEHITLAKGVIAGTTNLVLGLALGASLPSAGVSAGALAVGALGYGASITLWVTGARDLGAARGQLIFSAAPFVGVLVAWSALGDHIRPAELAAVVLAAAGVTGVLRSQHEHRHDHLPAEHDHEHGHGDVHHDHVHVDVDDMGRGASVAEARHAHRHEHVAVAHVHPHVPDVHHRHAHQG